MYKVCNFITEENGESGTLIEAFCDDCYEEAAACLADKFRQAKEDPDMHPYLIVDQTRIKYRNK